ncbi:MAG: zinc ABC transporter substrate-binding protein, partial [Corynebacterium sp.]|nr:zinc ABC transporter substrate-binding protein [Corynebacterium sp.]
PVNSSAQITPAQVRDAADVVRDNDVPAVFCESTVDPGPKEQLIRETGAQDGGTLYVDSLTDADGDAPTYLDLIRHDVDTIVAGLGGER